MKKSTLLISMTALLLAGCSFPRDKKEDTQGVVNYITMPSGAMNNKIFGNIVSEDLGENTYTIKGNISGSFDSIDATRSYGDTSDAPFQLKKYKSGDSTFTYNVSPKLGNIKNGVNTYTFKGINTGGTEEISITIEGSEIAYVEGQDPELCLFDICIDSKQNYSKKNGTITQKLCQDDNGEFVACSGENSSFETETKINKTALTAEKKVSDFTSTESYIYNKGNFLVRSQIENSCGGGTFSQKLWDLEGNTIEDIENYIDAKYPRSFKVGNIEYILTSNFNFSKDIYYYGTLPEDVEIETAFSANDDIGSKILANAKTEKYLSKNYIIHFKDLPNVKFKYISNDKNQSERIANLGDGKDILNENGDLMDLKLTNKIISYYAGDPSQENFDREAYTKLNPFNRNIVLKDGNNTIVKSVSSKDLPIFSAKAIDNAGNYAIYFKPSKKYEITTFAEMCKPVVYVYTSQPEEQTLTVNISKGGSFTKIIPDFSNGSTWDYTAMGDKVKVDGKTRDYLYYSVKVREYSFNKDGWIVKGNEMKTFFEDKLPKIGFNSKEESDFEAYWLPEYKADQYYFISFKYNDQLDKYVTLQFNKPGNVFRVFMESYKIEQINPKYLYKNIGDKLDKNLIKTYTRGTDFDVFEWGGMLENIIY